jgi:hypothetical protein
VLNLLNKQEKKSFLSDTIYEPFDDGWLGFDEIAVGLN